MDSKKPNRNLNRFERRQKASLLRKDTRMKRLNRNLPSMPLPDNALELTNQLMPLLVGSMATRGPLVRHELEQHVNGEPTAGHIVDLLMNVAAQMDESIYALRPIDFLDHAAVILMLARDLAYKEGKIKQRPEGAPS
jgi:hypothetical protein